MKSFLKRNHVQTDSTEEIHEDDSLPVPGGSRTEYKYGIRGAGWQRSSLDSAILVSEKQLPEKETDSVR
jgi:hypothetical protein